MTREAAAAGRVWFVGDAPQLRQQLEQILGRPVAEGLPAAGQPAAADTVFVQVGAPRALATRRGANAFSLCRSLKQQPGIRVILLAAEDDPYAAEIARFCLADTCLPVGAAGLSGTAATQLEQLGGVRARVSVDEMLASYEKKIAANTTLQQAGLERMLGGTREESLLALLTDEETGLYDGPYASLKLDEEFKRALRFHQPLSLLLLDIGCAPAVLHDDPARRRLMLAEVAAVFLNECRDIDLLARFTPTTFLFLLPGTGSDGAAVLARRMLDGLRQRSPVAGVPLQPAAGLVTVPQAGITRREEFLRLAEGRLGAAQAGRGAHGLCVGSE